MTIDPPMPKIPTTGAILDSSSENGEGYRERLARIALDSMSQFVAVLDAAGTVLEVSQKALNTAGISLSDVERRPFWTTFWWQTSAKPGAALRDAVGRASQGEFVQWNSEIYLSAGRAETISVEVSLTPVKNDQNSVGFLVAELRDISQTRAHEQEIREHVQAAQFPALLSAIVDSSDDAIVSKDLNGIIMSWNKSAERLFGYAASEAIGQSITIIIPPDHLDEEPGILDRIRRGERVDHFETVRMRKDGARLNISLTISPVKNAEGRIIGASKIARDITERVRQEQALQAANAALKQANADLRQFAYSASHDLQEPLRMVAAYSELLKHKFGGTMGPHADEFIRNIVQGAVRMESLLRDLRTYTLVSTAENEPAKESDSGLVLKKVLTSLDVAIQEAGASITSTDLPCVGVHEFQLEQVFQNLISNAIRYRSKEPPCIEIAARPHNAEWLFTVRDNGIGIEPEYKEQIFGIFKRLHSSAEYPGTGMGLAICQRVIERAGGRIWVESEPGRGSTFCFTLPREAGRNRQVPTNMFDSSD